MQETNCACIYGSHEYSENTCGSCGKTYCWTCANGPHHDCGSWSGMKCPRCDAYIENDGEIEMLRQEIKRIDKSIQVKKEMRKDMLDELGTLTNRR